MNCKNLFARNKRSPVPLKIVMKEVLKHLHSKGVIPNAVFGDGSKTVAEIKKGFNRNG